jgi:hypothetical protein
MPHVTRAEAIRGFNKGLRKVRAAQAEARSLAIRDYAVRARAAVDALEQSSD